MKKMGHDTTVSKWFPLFLEKKKKTHKIILANDVE